MQTVISVPCFVCIICCTNWVVSFLHSQASVLAEKSECVNAMDIDLVISHLRLTYWLTYLWYKCINLHFLLLHLHVYSSSNYSIMLLYM